MSSGFFSFVRLLLNYEALVPFMVSKTALLVRFFFLLFLVFTKYCVNASGEVFANIHLLIIPITLQLVCALGNNELTVHTADL